MLRKRNLAAVALLISLGLGEAVRAQNPQTFLPLHSGNACPECGLDVGSDAGELVGDRDLRQIDITGQEQGQISDRLLQQAEDIADTIADPPGKARVLSEIALKYAELGEFSRSADLLLRALEVVNSIVDSRQKAILLSGIATQYARLGQSVEASELFSQAVEIANKIEGGSVRASVLAEIALKSTSLGLSEVSDRLLAQSEQVISESPVAGQPEVEEQPSLFPFEPIPWTGRIRLLGRFFSGNKTTSVFTVASDIERKWPRDQIDINLSATNDFDDSRSSPNQDNEFEGRFQVEYRHHATARWQYFVNSSARRDTLDDLDIRTSLYTGPGLNIWRGGKSQSFDMQLGLGVRFEESNRRSDDLDFPVAQYRVRYKDLYFDNVKFRNFYTLEVPLDNLEDFYMELNSSVAVPISGGWSFNNSLRIQYAAEPTRNNPNVEVKMETGLQYQF